MQKIKSLMLACALIVAAASSALAVDGATLPTFDLTSFYALGTLILAAGAGVFIFRKVRKLLGF